MTEWAEAVNVIPPRSESGGHLFYCRQIKHEPCPEPYMEVTCINRRRIITLLRCGCLPLEVESGRYRTPKTPLQQRICQICQKGVGDECHFLNSCVPVRISFKNVCSGNQFLGNGQCKLLCNEPNKQNHPSAAILLSVFGHRQGYK